MLDTQVGNVERLHVHVVGTELVSEGAVTFRARQGQVVQLQFVALVPAGSDRQIRQTVSLPVPVMWEVGWTQHVTGLRQLLPLTDVKSP